MNNIDRAIVLDEAKAYSDRKGGYTKPGKVLTFDGNLTGKTVSNEYVRVSSEIMDLTKAKNVTLMVDNGVEKNEISEGLTVAKTAYGATFLTYEDVCLVVVMEKGGELDGTYVWYLGDGVQYEGMVSKVEFAETIVPIDPKFLPGVCLPVVELSTKAIITETVYLSEADKTAMDDVWKKNTPCIISLGVDDMDDVLMSTFVRHSGSGYRAFQGIFYHSFAGLLAVTLEDNSDDGWKILVHTLLQEV